MEAKQSGPKIWSSALFIINVAWAMLATGVIAAGVVLLVASLYGVFGYGVSRIVPGGSGWHWLVALFGFVPGLPIWYVSLLVIWFTRGTAGRNLSRRFIGRWETRDPIQIGAMLLAGIVLLPFVFIGLDGARAFAGKPEWIFALSVPAGCILISLVFATNGLLNLSILLRRNDANPLVSQERAPEQGS